MRVTKFFEHTERCTDEISHFKQKRETTQETPPHPPLPLQLHRPMFSRAADSNQWSLSIVGHGDVNKAT